jgi:hypothetical protein
MWKNLGKFFFAIFCPIEINLTIFLADREKFSEFLIFFLKKVECGKMWDKYECGKNLGKIVEMWNFSHNVGKV